MFPHPQGHTLDNLTTTCAIVIYSLIGFSRLQGFLLALLPGWEPGYSLGFFPFSAINTWTRRTRFHTCRSPLIGFHNLPAGPTPSSIAGLFHPAGTPRVNAFKASHWYDLRSSSETECSFAVTSPFMDSFHALISIPAYSHRRGLSIPTMSPTHSPLSPYEDRLPSWV